MSSERKDTREGTRIPLHQQNVLSQDTRDGFVRAWVPDLPGNIESYRLAGWEVVDDPEMKTHDGQIQISEKFGTAQVRTFNMDKNAKWHDAILMEIREDWYKEDYMHEQKQIAQTEQQIDKTGELSGRNLYGPGLEISR